MRLALIRQRYNPYGGAERFAARALEALQSAASSILSAPPLNELH